MANNAGNQSDNLTENFKKYLEKHDIIATNSEIESLFALENDTTSKVPIVRGGSLYDNIIPGGEGVPDWYADLGTGQRRPEAGVTAGDVMQNLYEAAGIGLWQYFDVLAFGIPGAALTLADIDPVEEYKKAAGVDELTPLGKVGSVFGQAAGFLKPLRWISKGASIAVRNIPLLNRTGGSKVVRSVIDDAAELAGTQGFAKDVVKRTLRTEFKAEQTARAVANYAISPEAIKTTQGLLKRNIGRSLRDVFPPSQYGEKSIALIDEMAERIVIGLGKSGRHLLLS